MRPLRAYISWEKIRRFSAEVLHVSHLFFTSEKRDTQNLIDDLSIKNLTLILINYEK